MSFRNLVDLYQQSIKRFAHRPLYGERTPAGNWAYKTYREFGKHVEQFRGGLASLGVGEGDRVAIISNNCPQWAVGAYATYSLGACYVPMYEKQNPADWQYILNDSGAKILLAANTEIADTVRGFMDKVKTLATVVDLSAATSDENSYASLLKKGNANPVDAADPDPSTLCGFIYTSGTTGPPKGAMLSHKNLVFEADAILKSADLGDEDSTLSFLPLSHVAERLQGELVGISAGLTVNYAESMETILRDVGETHATALLCVPRLWEKIYANVQSGLQDASPLKRRIFDWSMAVGTECFEIENAGGQVGTVLNAKRAVADRLVFSKLRAKLGMTHTRTLLSGAAPLSATVGTFFASMGLRIQEAYGQTECAGVSNINPPDRMKFGTVGPKLEGVEVKIADDGEILVQGDNVFLGYFKDEAATASALVDGWLHTGDIGQFDEEGYLKITDRKKDILVTAGGKNVAPQNIENQLKPYAGVSQVVVVGDKRKFLSALVTLDHEEMAKTLDTTLPPMEDCVDHKAILAQVQGYIDEVNAGLASYESVKKFPLLPRDFTIEDGELTPTLKVKRRIVQKQYEALIDSMYDEKFE